MTLNLCIVKICSCKIAKLQWSYAVKLHLIMLISRNHWSRAKFYMDWYIYVKLEVCQYFWQMSVDCWFYSQSGQTEDYAIFICCIAKHARSSKEGNQRYVTSEYCQCVRFYWTGNLFMKSMNIPTGYSEAAHRRWKDNTMAKRNIAKGQTTIFKNYILN